MKIHDPVVRSLRSRRRQRGLTLIESAIVLAVAAIALVFFTRMMSDNAEQVKAKGISEKMVEVHEAARSYVKTYNAALMTAASGSSVVVIPAGRPDPTSSVPSGPSAALPSLQGGGFLSPSFVDRNGYGQRHALLVRRVLAPNGDPRLDAIVTTYSGTKVSDRQLGRIAGYLGAAGGYVPVRANASAGINTATVYGSYGGWRSLTSNWSGAGGSAPSSGAVVATLAFEDGRLLADFLYRNDIGVPEANRMNTSIDVNRNNLNNVATMSGASDAAGVRNLQLDAGNVNATGNVNTAGSVRAGIDIWADGNITSSKTVRGNNLVAAKDASNMGGDLAVAGAASIAGDANVIGNVNVNGNTTVNGNLTAYRLNADSLIYDTAGRWNGSFRLRDLLPKQVGQASFAVVHGQYVAKPSCPAGSTAKLLLYRQQDSTRFAPGWDPGYVDVVDALNATDYGTSWQIWWSGQDAVPGYAKTAVAQTFCFYG